MAGRREDGAEGPEESRRALRIGGMKTSAMHSEEEKKGPEEREEPAELEGHAVPLAPHCLPTAPPSLPAPSTTTSLLFFC